VAMAGSILSGVYRARMSDAELPSQIRELPQATEQEARTSAEAARSLADSLHLPELATTADRAFLDAMYAATLSIAALALIGFAVSVVGLRTGPPKPADVPAAREERDDVQVEST